MEVLNVVRPKQKTAMRLTHGLYAHLVVANPSHMFHFRRIESFLVGAVVFLISSLIRHCKPSSHNHSLTLRTQAHPHDREHTKSRAALLRPGFFLLKRVSQKWLRFWDKDTRKNKDLKHVS